MAGLPSALQLQEVRNRMSYHYSMTPHDRAAAVFEDAERLALEFPTLDMIAEAINTAQSEAILHTAGCDAHSRWYGREIAGIDAVTGCPREHQRKGATKRTITQKLYEDAVAQRCPRCGARLFVDSHTPAGDHPELMTDRFQCTRCDYHGEELPHQKPPDKPAALAPRP
jgi:hypothetical protein